MTKGRLFLVLPLILALVSGCVKNPNAPAQVSGTVTYNGQPLKGGMLTLHSKDAGVYSAGIRSDGTYSATDLPAGEMVVTVETESVNPNKKTPQYGGGRGAPPPKGAGPQPYKPPGAPADAGTKGPDPAEYVKIPAKYADPKKSGLTVTLSQGRQTHNFELTD
jgi:hypothetical protein